jgi:uncharacterized iron-regulated membrane protein
MFRKILFWAHLVCGVLAGIVVFTMSLTGVVLTYERQINAWVAQGRYLPEAEQGEPLPLEQLLLIQRTAMPDIEATTLVLNKAPGAPVSFRAGRRGGLDLNPYTGAEMAMASPALDSFFSAMTGFHRWFNVDGENRALARQITGVSNVIFLFLVVSGLYLWLPSLWQWGVLKARLLLRASYPNSKARDFHWHHVFGIWAALPLLAVVYTGAVISYPWAANLMYLAFGAEVPAAPGAPQGARLNAANRNGADAANGSATAALQPAAFLPLRELVKRAVADSGGDWQRLNVTLPRAEATTVQIEVDRGNGAQAHKRHTLSLDRSTGAIINVRTFADTPEAQRLRGIARFLHTGEVLGFWGQTIAGLASFAALFMVWTGFALSWRRLVQPLLRK